MCECMEINQNNIIYDLRKVASKLNQNHLNETEYIKNGGLYPLSILDEYSDEIGGFVNNLELAGLKYKE